MSERKRVPRGVKLRGADKIHRIAAKDVTGREPDVATTAVPRKPDWIRVRLPGSPRVNRIKSLLRDKKLATVCEEASCPNLGECFHKGTATFLIMGDICTRRCPFCDVASGRPGPLDPDEPKKLAEAVAAMGLRYVVVTSVDRDDLDDGGADHFRRCIRELRQADGSVQVEILVPDFKGKVAKALEILVTAPADVFNHNLETVPSLYRRVRPGAVYRESLALLAEHKRLAPHVPTKSGVMLGVGETFVEVVAVMRELREHDVDMLTLGQYLQPSKHHLPVARYVHPDEFDLLAELGGELGFAHVASGPLVRSSYHADEQARGTLTSDR